MRSKASVLFLMGALLCLCACARSSDRSSDNRNAVRQSACDGITQSQLELCNAVVDKRFELLDKMPQGAGERFPDFVDTVYKDTRTLREVIGRARSDVRFLCKVPKLRTEYDHVECAPMSTMMAYMTTSSSSVAVDDLAAVVKQFQLAGRVLGKCENGAWVAIATNSAGTVGANGVLDDPIQKLLVAACDKTTDPLPQTGSTGTSPTGPASGYSGWTGIDSSKSCGLNVGATTSIASFTKGAMSRVDAMKDRCTATLVDSLRSDTDGDLTPPDTSDSSGSGDSGAGSPGTETKTDNGDGTETVCTEDGCYVRYKTAGASKPVDKSCTGNTCVTIENLGQDQNGQPQANKNVENNKANGGKGVWVQFSWDPAGRRWRAVANGDNSTPPLVGPHDCVDEACSSCKAFMDLYPKLEASCRGGGSASELCAEFASASSCCTNPNAIHADPRVIIPNSTGDMVCYGTDPNLQAQSCQQRCSVAADSDGCTIACKGSMPSDFKMDILDVLCQRAISDECFVSNGIAIPPTGTVRPGFGPPPKPASAPGLGMLFQR